MTTENYVGKTRFNVKFLQYMITKSKFIRLQKTIIACWKYYWIEQGENQEIGILFGFLLPIIVPDGCGFDSFQSVNSRSGQEVAL